MTDAEIAAIVQRSDLQSCACGSDVRALAAECERLRECCIKEFEAFEAASLEAEHFATQVVKIKNELDLLKNMNKDNK